MSSVCGHGVHFRRSRLCDSGELHLLRRPALAGAIEVRLNAGVNGKSGLIQVVVTIFPDQDPSFEETIVVQPVACIGVAFDEASHGPSTALRPSSESVIRGEHVLAVLGPRMLNHRFE